jgi:hypothetical protein
MEGEQYYVINPDTLSDCEHWSYQDLQKLCIKLKLGGRGSRNMLESKLQDWHRNRDVRGRANDDEEIIPMNVRVNNFSLLQIKLTEKTSVKRRKSSSFFRQENNRQEIVSPTILRPLKDSTTPGKSILKRAVENSEENLSDNIQSYQQTPMKLAKLKFSPFNGVKVIANRLDHNNDLIASRLF